MSFNHWFAQGAIPGSITKGVITLLKKGCRHVRGDLDDYRPITLLNTELKILAQVLANRLQLVISDLIGPKQCYAVKGDGFGFEPEFRKWISMLYRNPQAVVQVNGRCSEVFAIERSFQQGCLLSPLLYVLVLEPLLRRLRDEGACPALRGILLTGSV